MSYRQTTQSFLFNPMDFSTVSNVNIAGQNVSFERFTSSPTGWCATGWEQGLPVARRPISESELKAILSRFDPSLIHYR
jgi:hypothetical protein